MYAAMTKVQFLNVKPFISSCKDFEIVYRFHSPINASSFQAMDTADDHCHSSKKSSNSKLESADVSNHKHYIALYSDWSCKLLECRGKTVVEQEGTIVKWGKGKVIFAKQDLQKLSDGRKYYLMCRNEDGTKLGESRPFQFCTESHKFCKNATKSSKSTTVEENNYTKVEDKLLTSSYTEKKNIPNSDSLKTKNMQLQHASIKKETVSKPSIIRKLKSLLIEISVTLLYTVNLLSNSMQDVKTLVDSFTTQLQKVLVENAAQMQGTPKDNREYEIMIKYYSEFCATIRDVNEIAAYCVSRKLIPPQRVITLLDTKDPSEQVMKLLDPIMGPVQAGRPEGFHSLLDIMEKHGLQATQELATEVKHSLESCGDDELELLKEQLCDIRCRLTRSNLEQDDQKKVNDTIQRVEQELEELLEDTCYQAIYDYNAEEDDEVSFTEGDIIVSPHFSHYEGWMMGCVERTGLNGLFPLNYVQRIA